MDSVSIITILFSAVYVHSDAVYNVYRLYIHMFVLFVQHEGVFILLTDKLNLDLQFLG